MEAAAAAAAAAASSAAAAADASAQVAHNVAWHGMAMAAVGRCGFV